MGWIAPDRSWTEDGVHGLGFVSHLGLVGSYLPLFERLPELYAGGFTPSAGSEPQMHVELNARANAAAFARYFADSDPLDREHLRPRAAGLAAALRAALRLRRRRLARPRARARAHEDAARAPPRRAPAADGRRRSQRGGAAARAPDAVVGGRRRARPARPSRRPRRAARPARRRRPADRGRPAPARVRRARPRRERRAEHRHRHVERRLHRRARRGAGRRRRRGEPGVAPRALGAARRAPRARRARGALRRAGGHRAPSRRAAQPRLRRLPGLRRRAQRRAAGVHPRLPPGRPARGRDRHALLSDVAAVRRRQPQPPAQQPRRPRCCRRAIRRRRARTPGSRIPGVDLRDGRDLHELLYDEGDLRHPRLWASAPTQVLVTQTMATLEARVEALPRGEVLRVLDYGTGTALAAIELLKACRERGFGERLRRRGVEFELHLVDIPSAWFAQGHALVQDLPWTRCHPLIGADGRFRTMLDVTDGGADGRRHLEHGLSPHPTAGARAGGREPGRRHGPRRPPLVERARPRPARAVGRARSTSPTAWCASAGSSC